ncbi:MAG: hypothetical protein HN712_15755 [Gemmatimonadetes bacterium]|jgi:uroporphyrinogen decarboxylase|nr:hypothetical protein [Gemmatimonadota bacterium]MBT6150306.1 hypothetical protein [Gemmatimonadota bacterium]MBT7861776.1 hypothetical protein [Gemmatimonadota bacterium]
MTECENLLRAVRFESPDHIPMVFHINAACWHHYPQDDLEALMADHPILFPEFERSTRRVELNSDRDVRANRSFVDPWGCTRDTGIDGIATVVTRHALTDWDDLPDFRAPDPATSTGAGPIDWQAVEAQFAATIAAGGLPRGGLNHGHTYLTLSDVRGYENLTYDMADDEPRLWQLIEMVEAFNAESVRRYIEAGAQWMGYADDLGMQEGPMMSPTHFRKYLKPSYGRLIAPAREAGCIVHMHSDGDIRELADDILDAGVEVINLQDLVNGLDWLEARLAGKVCIELDIDRQSVTPYGTPEQIDALVREEVERLGSREGGLMMIYGLYPEVPLANAAALMDAMERYSTYYS